jgi:type II secretory pathway pseudopilin PulG
VIAIIAILAAILFPVFAKAREKARQTSCLNNQKQIVTSALMYAQDHDEMLPTSDLFWGVLNIDKGVLKCPTKSRLANGYAFNGRVSGKALGEIADPTIAVITIDALPLASDPYPNVAMSNLAIDPRHANAAISSYLDGHVVMDKETILLPYPDVPVTSGLTFWLRADSLALSTGAAVSSWKESTPSVSSTLTAIGTITYSKTGLNGNPGCNFTGSWPYYVTPDLSSRWGGSTNGTLFMVFAPTNDANEVFWCSGRADTFMSFGSGQCYPGWFRNQRIENPWQGMPNTAGTISRVAVTSGTGNGTYICYVNGTAKAAQNPDWKTPAVCRVGANGTNGYLNGYLGEIIMYNSVLSAADYALVDDYLKAKWGM